MDPVKLLQLLFCLNLLMSHIYSFYPAKSCPHSRYRCPSYHQQSIGSTSWCSTGWGISSSSGNRHGGNSWGSYSGGSGNRIFPSSNTVLYSSSLDKIKLDSLDWSLQKGPDANHPNLASLEKVLDNKMNIPIEDLKAKLATQQPTSNEELKEILSLAMEESNDGHIVLNDRDGDSDGNRGEIEEVYITDQELKKLWLQISYKAMGKSMDKFNTEEALLLIADDEDEIMLDDDDDEIANGIRQGVIDENGEFAEDNEIYVTSIELERIWNERSQIKFGMPGQDYNELDALLLLDPEDADDVAEDGQEVEYVDSRRTRLESDGSSYWRDCFPDDPELADVLKATYEEIEDRSFRRPAWKKERPILTPDIDTQSFMGDMMFSNTYMTQRIPANWNDQEMEGMSEAYLSTGTMAWPGEEETDYNVKIDAWKRLKLPIGPDYDPQTFELIDFLANMLKSSSESSSVETQTSATAISDDRNVEVVEERGEEKTASDNTDIDWDTFDFAADEAERNAPKVFDETDYFAPLNLESDSENTEEQDDIIAKDAEETVSVANSAQIVTSQTSATQKKWETPTAWFDNPEYHANVGIDVWGQYDEKEFSDLDEDGNPKATKDDVYTALAMQYILNATDYYLTDHLAIHKKQEEMHAWSRILEAKLFEDESLLNEAIPAYLRPDMDRNITYTDELIEMKGKIVLQADSGDPKVEYATDSFVHNETMQPINKIGTIRTQYDWQDLSNPDEFEIDQRVVNKIQPLLEFVNHAAKLQSTKNDVLVFNYYGNMRHLIGIRANMIQIAKKCYPDMVDLLLETPRASDKFDI